MIGEPAIPAPSAPGTAAVQQGEAVAPVPLAARPLPGAGDPGVRAAALVPESFPLGSGATPWWSGPAAIGGGAGGTVATAGRATASFFTRLGSHVPQLLKR
jgi:hypothetical protein